MSNWVNGGMVLRPGLPRLELERTPAFFEKFSRLTPLDQAEVIDVLKRMARQQSFNDALGEVRGREGGDTVAPKAWRDL